TGESNDFLGDQVRGFGFLHDGSVDTLNRFHSVGAFLRQVPGVNLPNPGGFEMSPAGNKLRRQVEQFLLAFDTNLKPVVGQQITVTSVNRSISTQRLNLLMARAEAGDCELIAKLNGRGFLYSGHGFFTQDKVNTPLISSDSLLSSVSV